MSFQLKQKTSFSQVSGKPSAINIKKLSSWAIDCAKLCWTLCSKVILSSPCLQLKQKERWLQCCHWRELWRMVSLHFWVGLTSHVSPGTSIITRIRRPSKSILSFQRWIPWIGRDELACTYLLPTASPYVGWKHPIHLDTSTNNWVDHSDWMHRKIKCFLKLIKN